MRGKKVWKNLVLVVAIGAGATALTMYLRQPEIVHLDAVKVVCGSMQVAVEEQGETRARDQFVIAAPVEGEVRRILLREGDRVEAGQVVAVLRPSPLAVQPRTENRARIAAAESLVAEAQARVQQTLREWELAQKERDRVEKLVRSGDVAERNLDQARTAESVAAEQVAAARAHLDAAHHEVTALRAMQIAVDPPPAAMMNVRSPVSGRVLTVLQQSERVVPAGMQLLTLGDARSLEVVVDVLSSDAVRIRKGDLMLLEEWGADHPLRARVRLVEPQAFTKVSALGVEEKRVHVLADLESRPDELGVGYRVEAKIVIWSGDQLLKIPSSSAFRRGTSWVVFVIRDGIVQAQKVEVGHRNDEELEVISGLREGDVVVRRPERDLREGAQAVPVGL